MTQVTVCGRHWSQMWDDGQHGIYRLEAKSTTTVKRKHELIDNDALQLVDGLVDKTYEHAKRAVLSDQTRRVTNTPSMSALSNISKLLDKDDENDVDDVHHSDTKSTVRGHTPSQPVQGQTQSDERPYSWLPSSHLHMRRRTRSQRPSQKAKQVPNQSQDRKREPMEPQVMMKLGPKKHVSSHHWNQLQRQARHIEQTMWLLPTRWRRQTRHGWTMPKPA